MIEKLVEIDARLLAALEAVASAAKVNLALDELQRMSTDCKNDQVSSKRYVFCDSHSLRLSGFVEEYEPETIFIRIKASQSAERQYADLLQDLYPDG